MPLQSIRNRLFHILGIEGSVSHAEKLASTLGGFVGIFFISWISFNVTGASGSALIVPSMGASAVLVFAVPHGKLSQPWALLGGHFCSALVGVTCYQLFPDMLFAAAGLAVGLAIGTMHVLRCIHPPGGATALAAVIGGAKIHALGYGYVLTPVMLNALIILVTAVLFNNFFPWRRYPTSLMRFTDTPSPADKSSRYIGKEYIARALDDMDQVIDLDIEEIQQIIALTLEHASTPSFSPGQIILGHYYTNSKHGAEWQVRQIIDEHRSPDPEKDMVIYRVVEGQGIKKADSCTRTEFAQWAVRELFPAHPESN